MLLTEALLKDVQSINGEWYHGDLNRRVGFEDQKMQSEQRNAMGPGIYFTSDKDQAIGYAFPNGYVYTANIVGNFITDKKKATVKEIKSFLMMLDDDTRETLFSNWDENPAIAQREIERQYANTNFIDCFADLGLGTDFRSEGRIWASLMVKLGYSGAIHKPNEEQFPHISHLIVWDPNVIEIKSEEKYSDLRTT